MLVALRNHKSTFYHLDPSQMPFLAIGRALQLIVFRVSLPKALFEASLPS